MIGMVESLQLSCNKDRNWKFFCIMLQNAWGDLTQCSLNMPHFMLFYTKCSACVRHWLRPKGKQCGQKGQIWRRTYWWTWDDREWLLTGRLLRKKQLLCWIKKSVDMRGKNILYCTLWGCSLFLCKRPMNLLFALIVKVFVLEKLVIYYLYK